MTKFARILLGAILLATALVVGSRLVEADSTDARIDQSFTALRNGKFSAATAHFDPTMKAALSSDQLGAVWFQIVANDGKLEKWQIIQRGKISGIDVLSVELTFDHGKQISTVSVRPDSNEIAGLYFKPVARGAAQTDPD